MTIDDIVDVASWNLLQNNMYMYAVPVLPTDAQIYYLALKGFSGTALNILSASAPNDYIEQSPCEILGATNYEDTGAAQNYMFYQFPSRNITVSDDPTADMFDKVRCNYIGVTQSAGQQVAFYQRGILCGGTEATP